MASLPHRPGRLALVGALAAVALVTSACAHSGSSASAPAAAPSTISNPATMTTVTVGITGATAPPTFLPLIADKLGLDTANNLRISFVTLAPNVTAQALTKGSVDVLAAPSVETAILQGAPFRIFAGAAESYWHFVANNGIANWAGLAGKKVALPCGQAATCHSFMTDLLQAHGVDPNKVTFIYGTAQATYESLAAGSVDAALTTAPYTYSLQTAGKTKEFDITSAQKYLSTQFTASVSFINNHPDVISAFVKSMAAAEQKLTTTPLDPKVLSTIDAYEQANGINPATLDQQRFLTEFATDRSWQLVPTKTLITADLDLLKEIPQFTSSAANAKFTDLVYQMPEFAGQYG
ncbi:MAG TPA: ABC transporter substrate-binding protein [Pseudonocardiaceae bacterium]|jgi:ABC-type nitrate/sulfonate/bicarbonate transport system substrate-binding protein|nr:ABC transporter substrate-binding protein [Pseudonocardiaceae bacterium]